MALDQGLEVAGFSLPGGYVLKVVGANVVIQYKGTTVLSLTQAGVMTLAGTAAPSGFTATRVTFADAGGLLTDDAGMTYNAATNTLTVDAVVAALTGAVTGNVTGDLTGNVTGSLSGATVVGTTSVASPLLRQTGANGQVVGVKALTESTTILAAALTDTAIQIPANSIVVGVTVRVTTIIPTAATFDVGIAGSTTLYGTGILVAGGTTNASLGTTGMSINASAVAVRITPNLQPLAATGVVRVTIHYIDLTPPTS